MGRSRQRLFGFTLCAFVLHVPGTRKEQQTARTDTSPVGAGHQRMMDLLNININRCGEVRTAIRSRLTPRITMSLKPIATRNSPTRCG
jgi:hypothetical protein